MASVPVAHVSGSSAVEQHACAPVAGIFSVERDFAVTHMPSTWAAAMGGNDNARKRMRAVNRLIIASISREITHA